MHRIAVISDTHNLLRPEVISVIEGCDVILHAGDISKPEILEQLRALKEVYVVRGNNDRGWAEEIPYVLQFDLSGVSFCMTHIKKDVPTDHTADVIITGHSHRYACSWVENTLFLNPGSCGPRRFNQDITMAVLMLDDDPGPDNQALNRNAFAEKKCGNQDIKDRIHVERINIPHESGKKETTDGRKNIQSLNNVTSDLIRRICKDVDRNMNIADISSKQKVSMEITQQIVRLYLTHPGVTPDGIMAKLGL